MPPHSSGYSSVETSWKYPEIYLCGYKVNQVGKSHPELCACGMSPLRLCVRCVWRGDGDRVLGLFQKSIVFHGIYEAGSLIFYSTPICEFLSDSPALYLPSHSRSVGITDISHHGWLLRLALWIQFRSSDFEQWVPCYQSPFFSLFSVPNPITCDFIYWLLWWKWYEQISLPQRAWMTDKISSRSSLLRFFFFKVYYFMPSLPSWAICSWTVSQNKLFLP